MWTSRYFKQGDLKKSCFFGLSSYLTKKSIFLDYKDQLINIKNVRMASGKLSVIFVQF
jgi:hypothetical protein